VRARSSLGHCAERQHTALPSAAACPAPPSQAGVSPEGRLLQAFTRALLTAALAPEQAALALARVSAPERAATELLRLADALKQLWELLPSLGSIYSPGMPAAAVVSAAAAAAAASRRRGAVPAPEPAPGAPAPAGPAAAPAHSGGHSCGSNSSSSSGSRGPSADRPRSGSAGSKRARSGSQGSWPRESARALKLPYQPEHLSARRHAGAAGERRRARPAPGP
jgi:hypothetical protein